MAAALPPTCISESIIDTANFGPLASSHQKKPVNTVNRTTSAKNSPMSAFLSAIMPNVQTIEISANVQNRRVATFSIMLAQELALVLNRFNTVSITSALLIAENASVEHSSSPSITMATKRGLLLSVFPFI